MSDEGCHAEFCCRACGRHEAVSRWHVPERMFGLGGDFEYGECAACGALSIIHVPIDLHRYYPATYGAFGPIETRRSWRARLLDSDCFRLLKQVGVLQPDRDGRILDVGCGRGTHLHLLWREGYRQLGGIDPHLPDDAIREIPFPIRRGTMITCEGQWDLIMYHHVLEHVIDPRAELRAAGERLSSRGCLVVWVPVADCWARHHFGTYWAQWDAPRHLWVPTRRAMQRLAAEMGLEVAKSVETGEAFQVWASMAYRRRCRLREMYVRRRQLLRAAPMLVGQALWARWLNWRKRGDQAMFVLQKRQTPTG